MTPPILLLVGLAFGLAYANGANDVSKAIATLVGSGVTDYRRAIAWGTIGTAAGALLGAVLAKAMVATFGNGFLAAGTEPTLTAATATLVGAMAWVFIATRTGFPVSTTHAIVGSIAGVAVAAHGPASIEWSTVVGKIFVPLLLSPIASLALVTLLLRAGRSPGSAGTGAGGECLCADLEPAALAVGGADGATVLAAGVLRLSVVAGPREACASERPRLLRVSLDHLHWLTSGATSFARGLNDAPKIVALALAATALEGSGSSPNPHLLFTVVAGGMALGSLVAGKRVTHVLAEKVTPMDHREGFYANLATAGLVTAGATLGLPMSTTHVSFGGIVGVGARRSSLNRKALRDIGFAWLVTLPASAMLGIAAYAAGGVLFP